MLLKQTWGQGVMKASLAGSLDEKNDTEDANAAEFAWRHADGVPRGGIEP